MHDLIADLHDYNDWANEKILMMSESLHDEQLDTPREMGMETLRRTLFHLLAAETIWLERWRGQPWRALPLDPDGASVADLRESMRQIAQERSSFLDEHRADQWSAQIDYRDSLGVAHQHRLLDLILHVFNHATHHRAQALNFLKVFGQTVPAGLDYIYFRVAGASTAQSEAANEMLRKYGLDVGTLTGKEFAWHPSAVKRWFQYHDWANANVMDWASQLNDDQLRHDHGIGPGDIVSTLRHVFDVESWWFASLRGDSGQFGNASEFHSVDEMSGRWQTLRAQRNEFLDSLTDNSSRSLVDVSFGGPTLHFTVVEGLLQVLHHSTHHRAQLVNMHRHSDVAIKNIDLLYALDDLPASS